MPLELTEGAIAKVEEWLRVNLPAHVEAVNAHFGREPIEIAMPFLAGIAEQTVPPNPPALLIMGRDSAPGSISEEGYLETWQALDLIVIEWQASEDLIRRALYRQTNALVRALRAGEVAHAFQFTFNEPMIRYDPVYLDADEQVLWSDAQVSIRVLMEESD